MANLKAQDQQYIVNSYGRFDLLLKEGKGAVCFDETGKRYIDLTSGIGVNALGFCDDVWVQAVAKQAATLQHTSNLYYTEPCIQLAKALSEATGLCRTFFANSGAEANEGMIKLARKYSFDRYGKGRDVIMTLQNSFHGRTITTLAATGQDHFHNSFFPFTEGFVFAQPNNLSDVKEKLSDKVCAIMMEPVLGEGGVIALDKEFVQAVAKLCEERDILLLCDEVQTGVGRTGTFLASQQFDIKPDAVTLAKGLGGGLPIGAIVCGEKTKEVLGAGDHGSTYGGNPIASAGALTCIERINDPAFLQEVGRKADLIKTRLTAIDEVVSVSGMGLMIGIELKEKAAIDVVKYCLANGVLVLTAKTKVRLLPPLTISDDELNEALDVLCAALQQ